MNLCLVVDTHAESGLAEHRNTDERKVVRRGIRLGTHLRITNFKQHLVLVKANLTVQARLPGEAKVLDEAEIATVLGSESPLMMQTERRKTIVTRPLHSLGRSCLTAHDLPAGKLFHHREMGRVV